MQNQDKTSINKSRKSCIHKPHLTAFFCVHRYHIAIYLQLALFFFGSTHALAESKTFDVAACTFKGKPLYGKIQVVDAFPDVRVQIVSAFPDVKVEQVTAFPTSCGKWKFVSAFPDLKVEFVKSFPDIKIQFVDAFPGVR